ncbi:outer membrane protein [Mesonia sediminis]|uniref:Outer membrane protein n=1 Tax=Mesonia sediminis TaxID=1703946 RepID=A0ABW5SC28_9FLAO
MKKQLFFLSLFTILVSSSLLAQKNTKIGAFMAYGSEIENLGLGLNAEFDLTEKLALSPSFIYYLPKDEYGFKANWWELNADAHYYFLQEEQINVYGLGGLNYSHIKVSYENAWGYGGDYSASDGRFGLNLGGGINFNLNEKWLPFAEIKYVLIDDGQLVLGAGIKYVIN